MRWLVQLSVLACMICGCERKIEGPPPEPKYPVVTEIALQTKFYTYKIDSGTGERIFRQFHFSPTTFPESLSIETNYYPTPSDTIPFMTFKHRGKYEAEHIQVDATTRYIRVTNHFCRSEKRCAATCAGTTVPCEEWQTENFTIEGDLLHRPILVQDSQEYELFSTATPTTPTELWDFGSGILDEDGDQIPSFKPEATKSLN